jgi:hypothetical protein
MQLGEGRLAMPEISLHQLVTWVKWLTVSFCLAIGLWLALPARCRIFETRVQSCDCGGVTVNLYDNGGSAYSLTYKPYFFSWERLFFYAYNEPTVFSISCSGDTLILFDHMRNRTYLPMEQVRSQLIDHPMEYYRGQLSPDASSDLWFQRITLLIGLILLLLGSWPVFGHFRRRGDSPSS